MPTQPMQISHKYIATTTMQYIMIFTQAGTPQSPLPSQVSPKTAPRSLLRCPAPLRRLSPPRTALAVHAPHTAGSTRGRVGRGCDASSPLPRNNGPLPPTCSCKAGIHARIQRAPVCCRFFMLCSAVQLAGKKEIPGQIQYSTIEYIKLFKFLK